MPPIPPGSPDESRPVATSRDSRYSLSIEDAAELYAKAGHPRTLRTVQRYCASGHLDAVKVATTLGDKYFIDPKSLSRHVAQIEELSQFDTRATDRDLSRQAATENVQDLTGDRARQEATTGHDMSPPVAQPRVEQMPPQVGDMPRPTATADLPMSPLVAPSQPDASRYVAGLEREVERALEDRAFLKEQIKVKDEQIAALLERDRETNILVRGLQQMLTPLLGGGRRTSDHDSGSHFV